MLFVETLSVRDSKTPYTAFQGTPTGIPIDSTLGSRGYLALGSSGLRCCLELGVAAL